MATGTGTDNLRVIYSGNRNRRPGSRKYRMTGITDIRTVDMSRTLATGRCAVMTVNTVTHERRVVRCTTRSTRGWEPGRCAMTYVTFVSSHQV